MTDTATPHRKKKAPVVASTPNADPVFHRHVVGKASDKQIGEFVNLDPTIARRALEFVAEADPSEDGLADLDDIIAFRDNLDDSGWWLEYLLDMIHSPFLTPRQIILIQSACKRRNPTEVHGPDDKVPNPGTGPVDKPAPAPRKKVTGKPAATPPAKKAPAKKAPVKKAADVRNATPKELPKRAPVKKTPAKKAAAPARKAPAKKAVTPTRKAAPKKAAAKTTTARKAVAK